jgi:hypothetical protein
MVIPQRWWDSRIFWEQLSRFTVVTRQVRGRDLPFVVEATRRDSVHACTVDDIAAVLNTAPARHVSGIQGVLLRQPKRKEEVLASVWGRLGYAAEVGPIRGPVIVVEAQPIPMVVTWSARCDPAQQEELDRLRQEADRGEFNGRKHVLHFGLPAVRAVQLYRTVLHELGHWADYDEKVELPSGNGSGGSWIDFHEAYFRRPVSERESFAHRYACELAQDLKARGLIPFERILNVKKIAAEGLSPDDFICSLGASVGASGRRSAE